MKRTYRTNEAYIRAHDEDGIPTVVYSLTPEAARAVAVVLDEAARKSKPYDSGFGEDAAALFRAADKADRL